MKKHILLLIFFTLIISCGPKKEKKKEKFEYKRTQVEEKNDVIDDNEDQIKIVLNSYDNMMYDKKTIVVKYGKNVRLTLNHKGKIGKEFMGHNFVLLKKGINVDEFAKKATLAKSNDYIPDSDETIAFTKMLGGGESTTISFTAPESGTYTYICSFPGHYMIMRGELIVN
tara:strand:+ start:17788 stop:18297 length:510 start_codon:yes stop_codon:yes gene_type:complete